MTDNLGIALENEKDDSDEGKYFAALLETKKLNYSKSLSILRL